MSLGRRIASDIGGTFTDIAYIDGQGRLATGKLPSTPADFADGVVAGLVALLRRLEIDVGEIDEVLHGCTLATKAILEQKGARTALITTAGFRDVLELKRIRVPRLYEPLYVKPPPLVARRHRHEVTERIGADGGIVVPLDPASVEAAVERIAADGAEAVAICLLHAYANPAHERAVGEIVRRRLPDAFVTLSVDVLPEIREYERTSTTVINAYVGPPVRAYVEAMLDRLAKAGLPRRLMVMQSSGGILDARTVIRRPAQIVESGPAAGVIGAAEIGRRCGYRNLITFDMGGTTAKAAIIENGAYLQAEAIEVGGGISTGSALGGGGYALKLPAIDISEVGAGGGSIVWLDKAGSIKVGPQSAGAVPGPACYGTGGAEPTVTDANLVLGYLNPEALADGTVPIRPDRARSAIAERVAQPLGRQLIETAFGIHTVANANMMRAVKAVTTYRGRDPRDFALFAFGGNGGVHGVDLARVLQIDTMVVPPVAGVFSAAGLLFANQEMSLSATFAHPVDAVPAAEAAEIYDRLADQIAGHMDRGRDAIRFRRLADLRYGGQAFELTVTLPDGPLDADPWRELGDRFEAEHERRYGHKFAGSYSREIVNLRLTGGVAVETPDRPGRPGRLRADGNGRRVAGERRREVYFGPAFGPPRTTAVVDRGALTTTIRPGPLVVEEATATTVVPPDCTVRLDDFDNLIVAVGGKLPRRRPEGLRP